MPLFRGPLLPSGRVLTVYRAAVAPPDPWCTAMWAPGGSSGPRAACIRRCTYSCYRRARGAVGRCSRAPKWLASHGTWQVQGPAEGASARPATEVLCFWHEFLCFSTHLDFSRCSSGPRSRGTHVRMFGFPHSHRAPATRSAHLPMCGQTLYADSVLRDVQESLHAAAAPVGW
jgi:hypothetical protein